MRSARCLTRVSPFLIQRTIESTAALFEFSATAAGAGFVAADLGCREDRHWGIECAVEVANVFGFIGLDTDNEVDSLSLADFRDLGKAPFGLDS